MSHAFNPHVTEYDDMILEWIDFDEDLDHQSNIASPLYPSPTQQRPHQQLTQRDLLGQDWQITREDDGPLAQAQTQNAT